MKILLTLFVLLFSSSVVGFEVKELIGKSLQFKFENENYRFDFYKTGEIISEVYDKPLIYNYFERDDGFKAITWEIINSKNLREGNRNFQIYNSDLIYAILEAEENAEWEFYRIDEYKINEIEHNENMVLLTLKYLFQYGKNLDNSINRINEVCILEKYLSLKPNQKKDFIYIIYNSPLKEDQRALNEYFDNLNLNEEFVEELFEPMDDCFS